ncbi:MAG: MopE-related protein [Pseudomonadota bacterium]|nr:MopE-related protein [Pseudomonadota bacterium]
MLLLLSLLACDGPPKEDTGPAVVDSGEPLVDADGDGVPEGADCDDTDEYAYPGAHEVPYDGEDQDCDGLDANDVDGDGYVGEDGGGDDCNDANPEVHPDAPVQCSDLINEDCTEGWDQYDCDGDGYQDVDDCGREDPAIHPGADDPWYDGIDSDCDGRDDYDQDEDGEATVESGGTDCADLDPAINSVADERWDDQDNDCENGSDGLSSRDATSSWTGDSFVGEAQFAYDFAPLGDLDGDGYGDVVAGIPGYNTLSGRVAVIPYSVGSEVGTRVALATIDGDEGAYLGWAVSPVAGPTGQLLAVGAPAYASVYLFDAAALTGGAALTSADAVATITSSTYYLGGDLNAWDDGAGGQSLLAASFEVADAGTYVGLYPGAALTGDLAEANATWSATFTGDAYDADVLGDFDGDGLDEIGVATTGFGGTVRTYVYAGAAVATGTADSASQSGFTGHLFVGSAPDLDSDGYDELLVSEWAADGAGTAVGKVWAFNGPDAMTDGTTDLAFATVTGTTDSGLLRAAGGHADLDNDGAIDLIVCAPGDGLSAVRGTCAWVAGPDLVAGGDHAPGTAGPTFKGAADDDLFGSDARPDDVDGDGDADLWIGSPAANPGSLLLFQHE